MVTSATIAVLKKKNRSERVVEYSAPLLNSPTGLFSVALSMPPKPSSEMSFDPFSAARVVSSGVMAMPKLAACASVWLVADALTSLNMVVSSVSEATTNSVTVAAEVSETAAILNPGFVCSFDGSAPCPGRVTAGRELSPLKVVVWPPR